MEKVSVLVVEDQQLWQEIIREELESFNCQVDIAENYRDAKKKLINHTYDLITLDMALSPDEENLTVAASSGWRLLVNQLKHDFPGTTIVVISASFGDAPQRAFDLNRNYGVRYFMTKNDFDPITLKTWVDEIREFKGRGGRPEISYNDLLKLYQEQLMIQKINKVEAEKQKAKHGIDVPPIILHSIDEYDKEITRIQAEIVRLEKLMN
jgi:CheY-like chemotaxis protein